VMAGQSGKTAEVKSTEFPSGDRQWGRRRM
jgi:hypothetical protein